MKRRTYFQNQKGEGLVKAILMLALLAVAGYFGYQYLWPMVNGSGGNNPTALAQGTPTPGDGTVAGSPAAQQVQGAQAAGELMGSGR